MKRVATRRANGRAAVRLAVARAAVTRAVIAGTAALALVSLASPAVQAESPSVNRVDQGANWTAASWNAFYNGDQGSRIMPLAWIRALTQPDGQPFLADHLGRYGYLANPASPEGLPVGFTTNTYDQVVAIGMTCAACHTREITVGSSAWRIDGGPAIVDFQAFLSDLDLAVGELLSVSARFDQFATAVLGAGADQKAKDALRAEVQAWYGPYHTLIERSLPTPGWGPARLDAVAMIFNRLTGLDLGTAPDGVIATNIHTAVAPVRYPFLWNAPIQDKTQWPEFADNGSPILGLARNLGEVFGVFGYLRPQTHLDKTVVDYISHNSANFKGLMTLEALIAPESLGPPKFPWTIDAKLAATGKALFDRPAGSGGCVECHGVTPGQTRFPDHKTWATPLVDVGSDTREHEILLWTANTGVLNGARQPFSLTKVYGTCESSFTLLGNTVGAAIVQRALVSGVEALADDVKDQISRTKAAIETMKADHKALSALASQGSLKEARDAFHSPQAAHAGTGAASTGTAPTGTIQDPCWPPAAATPPYGYESRVMAGIWAAAPYLHNGSVPTLWDLLQPVQERPLSFPVGQAYDIERVGLAREQSQFNYTFTTTDCSNVNSGNSRCGHEYGTSLSTDEKKALLEYLKSL